MNPRLQSIFNNYYTENPKDFIDLIEIISIQGIDIIENIIKTLDKINPFGVNTEKIKMLCNRNKDIVLNDRKEITNDIELHSKLILKQYGSILNNSDVAFDKEVAII